MTQIISCETCAYHRLKTGRRLGRADVVTWGECIRRPPTVVVPTITVWPEVLLNDLCGEWSITFGGEPK